MNASDCASSTQHQSSKVRQIAQALPNQHANNGVGSEHAADAQNPAFQGSTAEAQVAAAIKNQRKAAMAARMRPRSQTGNTNVKNANLI